MNTNLLIGSALVAFGLITLVSRFVAPDSALFRMLGPLQETLGERTGLAVHVFAYTVIPLLAGASFLLSGLAAQP